MSEIERVGSRRPALMMLAALGAGMVTTTASAYELYAEGDDTLSFDATAMYSALTSKKSYAIGSANSEGRKNWQEGYLKYGFKGSYGVGEGAVIYGGLSGLSSATWGDGDAGGFSSGDERETDWEDAYVGWKSGERVPWLGKDGIDFSLGRQGLIIGDGFVIKNDGFNYGDVLGSTYDRGGAYYLAARQSFAKTAILRLGGSQGLRADVAWLKSDNAGQADFESALVNLEHVSDAGTFAFMYLHGLDVDKHLATSAQLERDGMDLYSLRAVTSAGVENLALSFEYVVEDKRNDADAGYGEVAYTLAGLPWTPVLTYRYSRFSKDYDSLFYGFNRGYGTWVQGEVAGNYAGPLSSNTQVQHVGLKVSPSQSLNLGALYFDFDTLKDSYGNFSGRELDFYAEWFPTSAWYISPTLGFYKPDKSLEDGGSQLGGDGLNTYAQITVGYTF